MNVREQVQAGKVVRYKGKNFVVKIWRRGEIYFVSYRTKAAHGATVEYYEYSNIDVAVAEFQHGAGLSW